MCVYAGFNSCRFGHIRCWLVFVCKHWCGIGPQFLLMEFILGMPTYIGCWAPHCILTMYFPYNLGPSIATLSTDHSLFYYNICLSCLYMSVLLVYLQICYRACTFIVYIFKGHVLVWLSFTSSPALMQSAMPTSLTTSLGLESGMGGMSILFVFSLFFMSVT